MQAIIIYTKDRHGYARITKEGELKLSIPIHLRNNKKFNETLLAKGNGLLKRYQAKTHIKTNNAEEIMIFGETVPIQEITSTPNKIPATLKEILYDYAEPILQEYSQKLSIQYKILKIRKTRSKWGSCTGTQVISLNLDLVHLPTRLIQYVIIHEACHLKIKDHSANFRNLVEIYCPNYKLLRKELRNYILH